MQGLPPPGIKVGSSSWKEVTLTLGEVNTTQVKIGRSGRSCNRKCTIRNGDLLVAVVTRSIGIWIRGGRVG